MQKKTIRLNDSFKHYTLDQDKACSPEETVERFQERLREQRLDVLREVRRIDNGRLDIPVYFSVCGKDAEAVIGTKKQMGKGSTPAQSRASACMELAERFSFFSFVAEPDNFIHDSWANLRQSGLPLMNLDLLLGSVHDQITSRATLEELFKDLPIRWTWATNLTNKEEVLVPFSWFYAINEFNGPCAGNSPAEAINQGISEVVERHVSAVISHGKIATPKIDPSSSKHPVVRDLLDKFSKNGIELYLNDFSLDTGIPTVAALAIDRSTFPASSEIVYTAGTTPSPDKAIIRALTEVAQLAGDFNSQSNYVASGLPKPLAMDEVRYITHSPDTIRVEEMIDLSHDNIRVEVENYVAALSRLSMEVFVIDVTHPQLAVPAYYTIIPGAQFRERSRIGNVGLFLAKLVAENNEEEPLQRRERLLAMQKHLPDAYYLEFYLGKGLIELGDFAGAVEHLRQALTMRPQEEDIPYIYSYLADCQKNLGLYDEAVASVEQGLNHDEQRPDLHNIAGVCHFKLGAFEQAIVHFHRAVELAPNSAIDYANLGINYQRIGDPESAITYLELALSLDPGLDFARDQLARCRG